MKYFNRDLSWLSFNHRVLQEAADESVPLFERLKFLAIFSSNLEEFFRVRVASLRSLIKLNKKTVRELGFDPRKLLKQIYKKVSLLQNEFGKIFRDQIIPDLLQNKILIKSDADLDGNERVFVEDYFVTNVQPYIAPIILIKKKVKPFLRTGVLYFAIAMSLKSSKSEKKKSYYGLVEIPSERMPRFIIIPGTDERVSVMFLDDIIRMHLGRVFHGYRIDEICSVKLTRDAELYIEDEFSGNLLEKIRKSLGKRITGSPSRFLFDERCSGKLLNFLTESLELSKDDLLPGARYHNFSDFFRFPHPSIPQLEFAPIEAILNKKLNLSDNIVDEVFKKDFLLNFPYQSFDHVLKFIDTAATDESVTEIKITLYRVAKQSKIIDSLINALKRGKRVVVFSEVKARFDEELNLEYAGILEANGAKVLYSIPGLKVHAKICQVSRRNDESVERCSFLSTGNFNENTSKIYSDIGLFTADKTLNDDVNRLFDYLEGKSKEAEFDELLVGQFNMKRKFLSLIQKEMDNSRNGIASSIILKLNSLEDRKMIDRLYEASNAGVSIQIIVRGICCLVPGVRGQSENIKVISIVDRFLEHSRIFIFSNKGERKIYISSADWMKRNLSRRIETAIVIKDERLKAVITDIVNFQLNDRTKARAIDVEQSNPYVEDREPNGEGSQAKTYKYLETRVELNSDLS